MRPILEIRRSLAGIPGALIEIPPQPAPWGIESGVEVTLLWEGREATESTDEDQIGWKQGFDSSDERIPDFDPIFEIGAEIDLVLPALGDERVDAIRQSVVLHGMDALGWYSSFHVTGLQWGAYVSMSGIAYLVREAFWDLPASLETKLHLAFHAILNHELFHFATDYAIAQSELAHLDRWWVPTTLAFAKETPPYFTQEEKLANAYMLKTFRAMKPELRVRGKQAALRNFTLKQPPGYKDGVLVEREGWSHNLQELAHAYVFFSDKGGRNMLLDDFRSGYDWALQFPIFPRIDWRF